jgi:hypothetical protein
MFNGLRNGRLRDHRHSTRRDMASVVFAYALFVCTLAIFPLPGLPVIAVILWFFARRDVISVGSRQGWFFMIRSIPLAWVLDLVRGLSVIAGTADYCRGSISSRSLAFAMRSHAVRVPHRH